MGGIMEGLRNGCLAPHGASGLKYAAEKEAHDKLQVSLHTGRVD